MQNDPIQGILFDAKYLLHFDKPIIRHGILNFVANVKTKFKILRTQPQPSPAMEMSYELYLSDIGANNSLQSDQAMRNLSDRLKHTKSN